MVIAPILDRRVLLGSTAAWALAAVGSAVRAAPLAMPGETPAGRGRFDQILLSCPGGPMLRITAPVNGVFRVQKGEAAAFALPSPILLAKPLLSMIADIDDRRATISCQGARLEIDRVTGVERFFRKGESAPFLSTGRFGLTPHTLFGDHGFQTHQGFVADADQSLHGLGSFQDGIADWRGKSLRLAPANTMAAVPLLTSSAGWGLLWHSGSRIDFADDGRGFVFESQFADTIDYCVLASATMDDAVVAYRQLTGRAPLHARSAYGYWQSKERYRSADELLSVGREYRRRGLPIDNIILDWEWWPRPEEWSGMTWDPVRFPDPAAMVRDLRALHFDLMVSIWPAIGNASVLARRLDAIGGRLPVNHWAPARVVDAWRPGPRAVYWDFARKALFDIGIRAFYMDATEPTFLNSVDRFSTEHDILANQRNATGAMARQLNTYSLAASSGAWKANRDHGTDRRLFVVTRSSFAGQQRYGAALWTGDIQASWRIFQIQIAACIQFSAAGMPYFSTDIGGFGVRHKFPDGLADPAYRELYVRWFQQAAMSSVFRAHGTDVPREIWQFGDEKSETYQALHKALRLRYRLLPLIYSLAADVTHRDGLITRPLAADFPEDRIARTSPHQYMFGKAILVSPVTKALVHPSRRSEESIAPDLLFDRDGQQHGVVATYFRNLDLTQPIGERRTEKLHEPWFRALPREVDGKPYSVRFEGRLRIPQDGSYRFVVASDGGVRLRIGGTQVIDAFANEAKANHEGRVSLKAGTMVDFVLEHRQPRPAHSQLQLNWEYPGLAEEVFAATGEFARWLPAGTTWIDFWTGERRPGGQWVQQNVPLDIIPLDVRSGSILALGPEVQWANADIAGPIELRIYPGADASFDLYDDAGDGYGYENGAFSWIPIAWDDARRRLTFHARQGGFPGMAARRTFHVLVVRPGTGGIQAPANFDRVIDYVGAEATWSFSY